MEGPLSTIATAWLPDVDLLTDRLVTAVFTDHPAWTDYRSVPPEDLRDGCRRYLMRVLELLADGRPWSTEDDPVAGPIGRQRAEQGVPLEVMLRTFRLGGRVVWEALLERTNGVAPADLGAAATAMWTVVDGLSSALSTSYRSAEAEQLRRDDQRRHALLEEVVAGGTTGQRVADQLDLPLAGHYLVVVADLDQDGTAALPGPQTALSALGVRSVWHVRTDTLVGLVPLESHDPAFVLARLRSLARGRVASAPTAAGLAGVAPAHRLAVLALGTLPRGSAALVRIEDRYPEAMLLRSPELRQRLADAWLGPVLRLPQREREVLLETLTAWLEADRSAGVAAERLYCHRNTVLNRLQRVTALVGRELTGRRAYVELSLALSALELPA
ncbi:CdaR family transcriptional regulator [Pseudonocardia sp. DSM 110487]|uniref:PucR family transcriptional regulator n=1 Tax=Pseudonocardia sp. DSM 110487 TaxID=2865833 RepID=UPI0021074988|nr:helix-turn-helix domain-containing protein [Pseudonocardia sp. DSM 110487]